MKFEFDRIYEEANKKLVAEINGTFGKSDVDIKISIIITGSDGDSSAVQWRKYDCDGVVIGSPQIMESKFSSAMAEPLFKQEYV